MAHEEAGLVAAYSLGPSHSTVEPPDARESVIADPAANIDERRHVHQEP
jgi:hypothetical protein